MKKLNLLYEGKAKKVYETEDENLCIFEYKDDATAFNGEKRGSFPKKGVINNQICNIIFKILQENGIKTQFVKELNERETLVKKTKIIPLEVIVRNIAAGSFSKRYHVSEGMVFKNPCFEFSYKNDALGDPLMNSSHAIALNILTEEQLKQIKNITFKINDELIKIFKKIDITLVDFKIEFGLNNENEIILCDEISPDTCRLWDINTNKKLDKDQFRLDLGEFSSVYNEVYKRLKSQFQLN